MRRLRADMPLLLALQGGGAHGAFTWGVLDRLLEESDFAIEAVSATSSGALNALAVAQGWLDGGREGARTCLDALWHGISTHTALARRLFNAAPPASRETLLGLSRHFTPEQFNPLGVNPVRDLALRLFDFERLRARAPFALYLAATRVRDGALALFGPQQIDIDAMLASTCLPQLFAPVTIDGETYWDGGWAGNPSLEPLIERHRGEDLLCVLVRPLSQPRLPQSAREIAERMAALGFSAAFLRELRSVLRAQRALAGKLVLSPPGRRLQALRLHLVAPGDALDTVTDRTPIDTRAPVLEAMRDSGRARAQAWLDGDDAADLAPLLG